MNPGDGSARKGTARPSFFGHHRRKLLALPFWLALLGGCQLYAWRNGLSSSEVAHRLADSSMITGIPGPLAFVAFFAVRPLVLFPASLLAIAAGFLFGPVPGIVLTVLGSNASAIVAYLAGRYFGRGALDPEHSERSRGVARRYANRLRRNAFEAVLMAQCTYLPFDLVNYLAGFLRVGWKPFVLATFLGSLPGIVSFVLLGASFEMDPAAGTMGLNPRVLVASAAIFLGSIVLSRCYKRLASGKEEPEPDEEQRSGTDGEREAARRYRGGLSPLLLFAGKSST